MFELHPREVSPEGIFISSPIILQAQDPHLKICMPTCCFKIAGEQRDNVVQDLIQNYNILNKNSLKVRKLVARKQVEGFLNAAVSVDKYSH